MHTIGEKILNICFRIYNDFVGSSSLLTFHPLHFDDFYFFQIHKLYRSTGASIAKAQAEFTSGVMSNETVRQAAADAARESVRSQFAENNQTGNGNRY